MVNCMVTICKYPEMSQHVHVFLWDGSILSDFLGFVFHWEVEALWKLDIFALGVISVNPKWIRDLFQKIQANHLNLFFQG